MELGAGLREVTGTGRLTAACSSGSGPVRPQKGAPCGVLGCPPHPQGGTHTAPSPGTCLPLCRSHAEKKKTNTKMLSLQGPSTKWKNQRASNKPSRQQAGSEAFPPKGAARSNPQLSPYPRASLRPGAKAVLLEPCGTQLVLAEADRGKNWI